MINQNKLLSKCQGLDLAPNHVLTRKSISTASTKYQSQLQLKISIHVTWLRHFLSIVEFFIFFPTASTKSQNSQISRRNFQRIEIALEFYYMCIVILISPIKKMMGCTAWFVVVAYQGTHPYLPDEMSNDSDSSDDDRSYSSVHTS